MKKRHFCFDLHNLLTIVIDDRRTIFQKLIGIHHRYKAYLIGEERKSGPDIQVILGSFKPDITGCINIDSNIYIKENYLFVDNERSKLGGKIRFEVNGLEENRVTLHIDSNITASPFVAGRIIDFFISFILTKKGYSLIHASGVSKNDKGIVFSARGGGGKTTTALYAVQKNDFKYLADNFLILGKDKMWGLLSDINFFGYNINNDIWKKLSLYEKIKYRFVMGIYFLTHGYIKIFLSINPLRLFKDVINNSSHINKFCSVVTKDQYIDPQKMLRELVTYRTVMNQILEFPFLSRYIDEYRCVFQNSYFSNYWSEYKRKLQVSLDEEIDYYEITIPQRISKEILDKLLSIV